jgi:hypothetical protein
MGLTSDYGLIVYSDFEMDVVGSGFVLSWNLSRATARNNREKKTELQGRS